MSSSVVPLLPSYVCVAISVHSHLLLFTLGLLAPAVWANLEQMMECMRELQLKDELKPMDGAAKEMGTRMEELKVSD